MPKIAIVTDSSACLPAELVQAHGIIIVPLAFLFDGQLYEDGSLTATQFFDLLRSARKMPTTASPAPAAFVEAFRRAAEFTEAALCVTLPSSFSGTHSSARNAVELAKQEVPGFPVRVIDSHCLAMSHGFAVLSAARAAQRGANMDEAETVVREVASRSYLIGVIDTLRYLAKSGRVPAILHWATSLLQIKPILAAEGEAVRAIARPRTTPAAITRLLSEVDRRLGAQRPLHLAVMHADAPALADDLAATVKERFAPEELLLTEFTSVMGAHTGPGFVGVAFFTGEPAAQDPQLSSTASNRAPEPSPEEDVRQLETVLTKVPPPQSRAALVMVTGLPGSGKTHFSRELALRYPLAHLSSDALRRALFDRPTHTTGESERLFAAVHALMERLLSRGVPVLLDATSLKEEHRHPAYEIARRTGASLVIVRTEAPEDVIRRRLDARLRGDDDGDASEATVQIYRRMKREAQPIQRPHITVNTSADLEPALQEVIRLLPAIGERVPR